MVISPDENYLVTTDKLDRRDGRLDDKVSHTVCVFDLKAKKKLYNIDSSLDIRRWSMINKNNLFVTRKSDPSQDRLLIIYDLLERKVLHDVDFNETYCEMLQLHSSEEYVFIYYQDNDVVRHYNSAELVHISSRRKCGKCPEQCKGLKAGGQVFGCDELYYALSHSDSKNEVTILYAGIVFRGVRAKKV